MAKDLTANVRSQKSLRYGTKPINLLEIEFGGAVGTKYYSDRDITVDSNTYVPVVKDWGVIDFILNKTATTKDLQIVLINSLDSPISDLFATASPEGKVARVYQWYGDLSDTADKTIIFNGRITSPVRYSIDTVSIDIVNRILDLETKIGKIVTQEEYPRSLPAHRGKVIPQVYGVVENVPAVCIFTAGKSSLRESLNDSSMTVEADDGSVFPTDATWVLIIEEEKIQMAAGDGGNTLTALQRGYDATTPALHIKGTQMYEQLSTFRYQVFDDTGGVKAKAISNVRVNGFLVSASQYSIDQATYPGQIVFNTYPQLEEQQETEFDEFEFDTVINDESVPYATNPDNLISGSSGYAELKSGQKVILQRAAAFGKVSRLKRTYLSVTYSTDKEEWGGEISAKAYWDGNDLGTLPDPPFDP